MGKRIAIVGVGAVGGYTGAHMVAAGEDVTFIDFWPEHVEKMKRDGLTITHDRAGDGRGRARLIAVDVNGEAASRTAQAIGRGAVGLACDVTDRAQCDGLAARVGREIGAIGVLVNNAGIIRRGEVTDPNACHDWDATLAVNLALQHGDGVSRSAARDQGRHHQYRFDSVLCRVAELGRLHDLEGWRTPADQGAGDGTGPMGIRVNAIGPGFTATPLNADARQNAGYMANFTGRIPLGRIGNPEDIAMPAVFLASDMARYITGVTLPVDGGYLAR